MKISSTIVSSTIVREMLYISTTQNKNSSGNKLASIDITFLQN